MIILHEWTVGVLGQVVVGIDEGDIVSCRDPYPCITGVTESAVHLMDDADAPVFGCPVVAADRTAVG